MEQHNEYQNPLCRRYAGSYMKHLFSDTNRHNLWRRLWRALAESQKELGLNITDDQMRELDEHTNDAVDYGRVAELEKETRHDVMAHLLAFGEVCPTAKPILHLGATSCYVTDNADVYLMRAAMRGTISIVNALVKCLSNFALKHKDTTCLAYTHLQAAQPTTMGKRAALWAQDFRCCLSNLDTALHHMQFLGCKGATGTQASMLQLFDGDHEKVKALDSMVIKKISPDARVWPITGQTYPRIQDFWVMSALAEVAIVAHKFASDIRLLQGFGEVAEFFSEGQVGSSAMPHKHNPIMSERVTSLSRYAINNLQNSAWTAAEQWLERSLDDSANRRIAIPEMFLCIDAIARTCIDIIQGLQVNEPLSLDLVRSEFPYMCMESLMMAAVIHGADRQQVHEQLREDYRLAHASGDPYGKMLTFLGTNAAVYGFTLDEVKEIHDLSRLAGRSSQQVSEYVQG